MTLWKRPALLETFAERAKNTAVGHVGIEVTEIGDDFLKGRMQVDHRTRQLHGILHGGASVLFAETLGSMAANLCLPEGELAAVGLDINANHLRPVADGWVYGCARALHIGATTHVWEIRITNAAEQLVCISRLTMAVIRRKPAADKA